MEGWRHWCRYWRGGNRRCWKINNTTHVLQDSHCFGYQHSWRFFCPSPGCRRLLSSIGKAFFKLTSFVNSRWECLEVLVWVYLTYMSTLLLLQDYRQQRPSQELVAKDLHGIEWKFRHIYRGTTDCYSLDSYWLKKCSGWLYWTSSNCRSATKASAHYRMECVCKQEEACFWWRCAFLKVRTAKSGRYSALCCFLSHVPIIFAGLLMENLG